IQADTAVAAAKRGQRQEALAALDRLQQSARGNVERTVILASAYVDSGDVGQGLSMMRSLLNRSDVPTADLQLQYGSVLLQAKEDGQVHTILLDLQNKPLSTKIRKRYDDLLHLYRIRQADRLRDAGNLAAAYDVLAPALVQ